MIGWRAVWNYCEMKLVVLIMITVATHTQLFLFCFDIICNICTDMILHGMSSQ